MRPHVAFVSISFGGKTREIHFTRCRCGIISWELLKLGSHFDVVEHILWKLAVLSVWRWRFHWAEKKETCTRGGDKVLLKNVAVCHGQTISKWDTVSKKKVETHLEKQRARERKKLNRSRGRETGRYRCCGYDNQSLCTIYLAAD